MNNYCVLVAEVALARIYTLESAELPEYESSPNLVERKCLVNPQHRAAEREVWTDTRRGANTEHHTSQRPGQVAATPHHNYDEHRENNERRSNRAFAKTLVGEIQQMVSGTGPQRLILCAEKQMLGYLRPELKDHLNKNVELRELPKDLTGFSAQALHEKLADEGLLPERKERPPTG